MKQSVTKTDLIVKTLIFMILAPGTITVALPLMILKNSRADTMMQSIEPNYLGLLFVLVGICICLWCFWDFIDKGIGTPSPFNPPKQLVVSGLYRYVRNPMFVGILLIIFGEAILISLPSLIFYLLILLLIFHINVVYYEEPKLRSEFGEQYDNYLLSVPRWVFMFRNK